MLSLPELNAIGDVLVSQSRYYLNFKWIPFKFENAELGMLFTSDATATLQTRYKSIASYKSALS